MGQVRVAAIIRNPADPERLWEGLFLVDTANMNSVVPRPHLDTIGLRPKGQRICETIEGNEAALDATVADIEVMGETVGATVLYGKSDAEPSLGLTALASAGIEVDPTNGKLKRRSAVRLKRVGVGAPQRTPSRRKPRETGPNDSSS